MARKHQHKAQVVTRFVRLPDELEDGKVRCAGCSKVVALTKNGRLRAHKMPGGEPCAHHAVYGEPVKLAELPPVKIRPQPHEASGRPRAPRASVPYVRTEVTGHCHECDRKITGERRYCGRCLSKRKL